MRCASLPRQCGAFQTVTIPKITEMEESTDEKYMRRALQLAACGAGHVSPNPMVGAVIVADGRIIGEGFHRRFGGPHAEVNAVNSVKDTDRHLLHSATIYVTLEPCSHYGKTPPCADLLIREGIPRIVIGSPDPFPEVSGRGVKKLRDAGRDVTVGLMREECDRLNRRFITAHTHRRPFVELKWAQTADGFIAASKAGGGSRPIRISTPLSMLWMHCDRSMADAIMVGTNTVLVDNPHFRLRFYPGRNPLRIIPDRHGRIPADFNIFADPDVLILKDDAPLSDMLRTLYEKHGITSLIVEGGARMLHSFIEEGLYDEIRVETAPFRIGHGLPAPGVPDNCLPEDSFSCGRNRIVRYEHKLIENEHENEKTYTCN